VKDLYQRSKNWSSGGGMLKFLMIVLKDEVCEQAPTAAQQKRMASCGMLGATEYLGEQWAATLGRPFYFR
jgi:hypothetical protein